MLDHSSRDQSSPEPGHIRLVERALPPSPIPDPTSVPVYGDGKKKGKKRRKKLEEGGLTTKAGKRDKKKGHSKQTKATEGPAAELARLNGTLAQLRNRLFDLNSVQLDHAEANASVGRRVDELAGLAAADGERREYLARRLEDLALAVEGLGSRVPGSAQDPQVEALVQRIARMEAALSVLGDGSVPRDRADLLLGEMEARLVVLQGALGAQADRLGQVEQGLAVALRPDVEPERAPWRGVIETVRAELDGRIAGLADGLDQTREQARKRREVEQRWTDSRLRRLGRSLAAAIVLVGLVTGALLAADWWRTQRELDRTAVRLEALEGQPVARMEPSAPPSPSAPSAAPAPDAAEIARLNARLERLESAPPSAQAAPISEDLLARLRRLENGLLETTGDLAASREAANALSLRLTDLVGAQQAVLQRLDALQRETAAADKGLAVLDARVSGTIKPAGQVAAPARTTEPGALPGVLPGVLDAPRYAIQLVAYTSRDRIGPFVDRYGIAGQASVIETRVSGRPAFAVVLGQYGRETEAREAVARLTGDLGALRPWVRRLPAGTRLYPVD